MVKSVTSVFKMLSSAYGLGHSFSPYGPPSKQITYMYIEDKNQFDHEGQSRSQSELLVKLSKLPKARGKSEQ